MRTVNVLGRSALLLCVSLSPAGTASTLRALAQDTAAPVGAAPVGAVEKDGARRELATLAREVPYLDLAAVLYDRTESFLAAADPDVMRRQFAVVKQLKSLRWSTESLRKLLSDPDARVRTLALVALWEREDASLLPDFAALSGDAAPTFDGHPELHKRWLQTTGIGPPQREQTVGTIASAMVNFYMEQAGFGYGIDPVALRGDSYKDQPGFPEYWKARAGRRFCASWFAVQMARASQSTSPLPKGRTANVRAVIARANALPPEDRAWTLMYLRALRWDDALTDDAEVVAAARVLGPDKLLQAAQGHIASDDPDLQPTPGQFGAREEVIHAMGTWILAHARELLRPDQALPLMQGRPANAATDRPAPLSTSPATVIAASELAPEHAAQWLHHAFDAARGNHNLENRSRLAAALWRLRGVEEMPFVLHWFFTEKAEPNAYPNAPAAFLDDARAHSRAEHKQLIAAIIADPRFNALDFQATKSLLETVNTWLPQPVATLRELWDAHDGRAGEAEAAGLHSIKARLRASVPRWK